MAETISGEVLLRLITDDEGNMPMAPSQPSAPGGKPSGVEGARPSDAFLPEGFKQLTGTQQEELSAA